MSKISARSYAQGCVEVFFFYSNQESGCSARGSHLEGQEVDFEKDIAHGYLEF